MSTPPSVLRLHCMEGMKDGYFLNKHVLVNRGHEMIYNSVQLPPMDEALSICGGRVKIHFQYCVL